MRNGLIKINWPALTDERNLFSKKDIKTPQFLTRTSSYFIILLCDQLSKACIYSFPFFFFLALEEKGGEKQWVKRMGEKIYNRVLYYVFFLCHRVRTKISRAKSFFFFFLYAWFLLLVVAFSYMTLLEFLILSFYI